MKTLILIGLVTLLLCCQKKEAVISDIEKLCAGSYSMSESTQLENGDCGESGFILQLNKMQGTIEFNKDINKYLIATNVNNTIDCQVIGVLCDSFPNLEGKDVEYSAKYFKYNGSLKPVFGGQVIFSVSNFSYKLK